MAEPFDRLVRQAEKLGNSCPIMPIDEVRLAVAFAALPDQPSVVLRLIRLFTHGNMHVRRIAINACRRSGTYHVQGLSEALVSRLRDPEARVRYDAAWAIDAAKFDSASIREELGRLAAGVNLPVDEPCVRKTLADALLQARVRAKQVLMSLQARAA